MLLRPRKVLTALAFVLCCFHGGVHHSCLRSYGRYLLITGQRVYGAERQPGPQAAPSLLGCSSWAVEPTLPSCSADMGTFHTQGPSLAFTEEVGIKNHVVRLERRGTGGREQGVLPSWFQKRKVLTQLNFFPPCFFSCQAAYFSRWRLQHSLHLSLCKHSICQTSLAFLVQKKYEHNNISIVQEASLRVSL